MDTNTRTQRRQLRWESVELILRSASGIAWDGCHTIYVLMDQPPVEQMRQYGYTAGDSSLVHVTDRRTPPPPRHLARAPLPRSGQPAPLPSLPGAPPGATQSRPAPPESG